MVIIVIGDNKSSNYDDNLTEDLHQSFTSQVNIAIVLVVASCTTA